MSPRLPIFACVAAIATVSVAPAAYAAVEYQLTPRLESRFSYHENIALRENGEPDTAEYRLLTGARFGASTETWQINGDAEASFSRFGDEAFDTDDQEGRLTFRHVTPRRQLQLSFNIDRESQRTAEEELSDELGASRVERVNVRPVGYWQIGERNGLTVGATFSNVHYESLRFDDYKNFAVDSVFSHALTERMALEFTAFASEYQGTPLPGCRGTFGGTVPLTSPNAFDPVILSDVDVERRDARTFGLEVGLRRAVSEALEWSVSVGGRQVENELNVVECERFVRSRSGIIVPTFIFPIGFVEAEQVLFGLRRGEGLGGVTDTDEGLSGRTSIRYAGEKITSELGYEQSVAPAGLGFLLDSKRLTGMAKYQYRRNLSFEARLLVSDNSSVAEEDNYQRDFWSLTGLVNWQPSERWRTTFGVRWRDREQPAQERDPDDPTMLRTVQRGADGTSVFLDIRYVGETYRRTR